MEGSQHQHLDYGRNQPIFEQSTSPLYASNDGVLQIERTSNPKGFAVVDATDRHVEMFTLKRPIADAFVAGYDYATRQR